MEQYQIGEKEYTLEELQSLIEDGQSKREYETKYNTNFESAWSAYGKTQNENRTLKEELEKERASRSQPNSEPTPTPNFDEVLAQKGYVSKEEVDRLFEEKITLKQQVETIASQMRSLEKDLNGSDGRPKFEINDMIEFMQQNNMTDPQKAYDYRFSKDIARWEAEQISRKPGFAPSNTQETNANRSPSPVRYNRDNVDAALREALSEGGGKI